jgi:hypothetical protein
MIENFDKLSKKVQDYIRKIERERDIAVRALNEHLDNETPSEIYIEEYESTGEEIGPTLKRRNIQGYKVSFEHAGVGLDVSIFDDNCIDLLWSKKNHLLSGDVAFIPSSYQGARLVSCDKMRQ